MDMHLDRFNPIGGPGDLGHRFRRATQRLGIKMTRLISGKESEWTTQEEREASTIFRLLLQDSRVELLTSPVSGKYYIRNDKMLLVLTSGQLSIINHVYGYNVPLARRTESHLRDMFLQEVERRRELMETEFHSNVSHSLKSIIENIRHGQ